MAAAKPADRIERCSAPDVHGRLACQGGARRGFRLAHDARGAKFSGRRIIATILFLGALYGGYDRLANGASSGESARRPRWEMAEPRS